MKMVDPQKLGITELVLRDAHQSLFATRMRIDDMLPIAEKLDNIGYWSIESWGGATFDACIRFLGEDPWERLRLLKAAMPNTPQQMLFRGQNILGYRHYADDVVSRFVERAAVNGVDVFRVFDAMNDVRNLKAAIKAVLDNDKHAQGTISYTVSPVHTEQMWIDLALQIEDLGAHSVCIKDMAGLLTPYVAFDLITELKKRLSIPVHLHCHATTGMSTTTLVKAVEAGVDVVDTSISSMSMTYGHSATESVVAIMRGQARDSALDISKLEEIAAYFREVRKKYAATEGSLKGVDSRILVAQVPGGMLTNLEGQLKEQNALDKMDAVLEEIPRVRKDLGYIPLVTPTSQIVGSQAVLNVLTGERYSNITKETAGVLKGEYGATPGSLNVELQARVLDGEEAISCRPADLLRPELEGLTAELRKLGKQHALLFANDFIDDVLTYALFPQVGLKFIQNRDNPEAFEPVPVIELTPVSGPQLYDIKVNDQSYRVEVASTGTISNISPCETTQTSVVSPPGNSQSVNAALSGNIVKLMSQVGQQVSAGDVVLVLEAMKMETEVRTPVSGILDSIPVSPGDAVSVGDVLFSIR